MPKRNSIWQFMGQHRVIRIVAGQLVVFAALSLLLLGNGFFTNVGDVFAASCASGDQTYVVRLGDTLAKIAKSNQTTEQALVSYNKLANPNLIFVNQYICIHGRAVTIENKPVGGNKAVVASSSPRGIRGTYNNFPYGQCTWWADQRYYQLTGIYVPWTTNSNANLWRLRALQYHWNVSSTPKLGSIMMLSPGVEGAFSDGHVAVVEKLLGNGRVDASQMNWGGQTGVVTHYIFTAAPGVYFISIN